MRRAFVTLRGSGRKMWDFLLPRVKHKETSEQGLEELTPSGEVI